MCTLLPPPRPQDFYLLLSNCYTYNKIGTGIHILGQRLEKMFNGELRKAGYPHLIRNIKRQSRCAGGGPAGERSRARPGGRAGGAAARQALRPVPSASKGV